MKRSFLCLAVVGLMLTAADAIAYPVIRVYTDKDLYTPGDTIEVSLSANNSGEGMGVSVYLGLLTPEGSLYTVGPEGWSQGLGPWIPEIYLPDGFSMSQTAYLLLDVPSSMPPIQNAGSYCLAAGLAYPGTFDFASDVKFTWFSVKPIRTHLYVSENLGYDGNDGSENRPFRTITKALEVGNGTELNPVTIHVEAGYYWGAPPGTDYYEDYPLNMKSWVSISGEGRDSTILDGIGLAQVIVCQNVSDLTIQGLTIINGRAGDNDGGGIYCYNSSPIITNNTIAGNSASDQAGGGICCDANSSPLIKENTIIANYAEWGGGICCIESSPTIMDNKITANSAGWGGGVYYINCSDMVYLKNNAITRNRARLNGPGVVSWDSLLTIESCTITRNGGGEVSPGIFCWEGPYPVAINCIVWGNGNSGGHCIATYCCISGTWGGEGNIPMDPMFVSGPSGEYFLDPNSPCIDTGSMSAAEAGLDKMTTQADGTPDTGTLDIGCHYPIR